MKRRHLLLTAAILPAARVRAAPARKASDSVLYRILMIDPRLIAKTRERVAVGYENKRADIMGSVSLSHDESAALKSILNTALTDSNNVPFCGHSPAYVIEESRQGQGAKRVSVCGLCFTWCREDGVLRVLGGDQLMPFLTKILPLPAAFSGVKELPDLFKLDREKSYLELPTPK